jgi:hypothetical protein
LYAILFRSFINPAGISDRKTLTVWGLASILYGCAIDAVAIEYPSGFFVAFPLIFVWGFGILGYFLYKSDTNTLKGIKSFGYCVVLQYYIFAYLIALVIIIIWLSLNGFDSRNQPKQ